VRRATVLIMILLAALVLAACGKDSPLTETTVQIGSTPPVTTPDTTTTATTATAPVVPRSARDGCQAVPAPQPSANANRTRTKRMLSRKRRYTAVLRTNCGTIRMRLDVRRAPKTTSSFAGLARSGFYDGLTFHRIAKPGGNDFVIQGGDPLGTGNGGPGYSVHEPPPKSTRYVRGVVAMAKTPDDAPGTSGSQFFIVTAADSRLPADYALVGRVIGGEAVVRRIAALATDPVTEMPLDPVVIERVRIEGP
jgi:cyclophilin family peptidyl-prolyl cis-trans isomerase